MGKSRNAEAREIRIRGIITGNAPTIDRRKKEIQMSASIRSFPAQQKASVVWRRIDNGTAEMLLAGKEKRKPRLGLGYWGARDATYKIR